MDRHDPIRRQARRDARAADRTGHMNARKNSARPRNGTAPINNTAPRNDPAPMHSTAPTNSIATTHSAAPMNDSRVGAAEVTAGKSMGRRMIPQAVRDSVLHAYGNRCAHVGSEGRCPETRNLDVDHIVPVAMGGTDEPDNLRPACRGHNQRFADLSFGRDLMNKHRQGTRKTTSVVRETSTPAPGVIARCAGEALPLRERWTVCSDEHSRSGSDARSAWTSTPTPGVMYGCSDTYFRSGSDGRYARTCTPAPGVMHGVLGQALPLRE